MGKYLTLFIVALIGVYFLLLAKPELYFNKKLEHGDFILRSRGTLPEAPEEVLDTARERIASSEIYKPGTKFEVVLVSGAGQYKFFTPFLDGEFFRVNPMSGVIYMAAADFDAKRAYQEPGSERWRSLSGALVAAGAWNMTRLRVQPLTFVTMKKWRVRGYAEILSGGTGEFNPADACAGGTRAGLEDYKFGLMLDRVLKEENTFYNDLLEKNYSQQVAENRFRQAYCGG